jgi:hypothetical protein
VSSGPASNRARGEIDTAALERYAQVARHAASLGLGVTAVIVDAAWPAWLGLEAWLLPWVVPHVIEQARRVVVTLDSLSGVVIFASPDELVTGGFVESSSPPWRRAARVDASLARKQIDSILATLSADPIVGPKIVATTRTVSLARPPADVARVTCATPPTLTRSTCVRWSRDAVRRSRPSASSSKERVAGA